MKRNILIFLCIVSVFFCNAQVVFDLSNFIPTDESISLDFKKIISIKNMSLDPTYEYSYKIEVEETAVPLFDISKLAGELCAEDGSVVNAAYQAAKKFLKNEKDERQIEHLVTEFDKAIKNLNVVTYKACIEDGNNIITRTHLERNISLDLKPNQVFTVTVTRKSTVAGSKTWVKIFRTPEKTRWLIHYGLTYTPNLITKVNNYYTQDTTVANTYRITKNNNNGPKPWENISATINFTYPWHADSRPYDGGFTAGFGINTGFGLSGHAGLSAIIGENVILSSGIVFMQKQQLKGQYKDGQIVKENLAFDALHEKVWLPELYFTIGFRFGSNPFAPKTATPVAPPAGPPAVPPAAAPAVPPAAVPAAAPATAPSAAAPTKLTTPREKS